MLQELFNVDRFICVTMLTLLRLHGITFQCKVWKIVSRKLILFLVLAISAIHSSMIMISKKLWKCPKIVVEFWMMPMIQISALRSSNVLTTIMMNPTSARTLWLRRLKMHWQTLSPLLLKRDLKTVKVNLIAKPWIWGKRHLISEYNQWLTTRCYQFNYSFKWSSGMSIFVIGANFSSQISIAHASPHPARRLIDNYSGCHDKEPSNDSIQLYILNI